MTVDPRLLLKTNRVDGCVRAAIRDAQKGRKRLRRHLKEADACFIVQLALSVEKRHEMLRQWSDGSRKALPKPSILDIEELKSAFREAASKLDRAMSYLRFPADECERGKCDRSIDRELHVAPLKVLLEIEEPDARAILNALTRSLGAMKRLSNAPAGRTSRPQNGKPELAFAWIDVFGERPGSAKDRNPFNMFYKTLVGRLPSVDVRRMIADLDNDTIQAIQRSGYPEWVLGRRPASFFTWTP